MDVETQYCFRAEGGGGTGGQGEKVRIPQLRKERRIEGGKDRVHVEECLCLSGGL